MERMPLIGDRFPEMEVVTTQGKKNLPGDYKGKWFILFSHPADFTPVCTTEFVAFQNRMQEFKDLGVDLIGLSVDQIYSHIKWIQWMKEELNVEIEFPVIADTGAISSNLGLIHPGKATNTVRAVFIIDPNGVIRAILYYPQELGRNIDEIIRMVKGLKINESDKVALPAGWPNNELIQDKVIIPPPADMQTANKRAKEYEGYDWWFSYKKL